VLANGCQPTHPARAPTTSSLGIAADGTVLYVALADRDEVRAVDATTGETRTVVPVVGHPHRLTVLDDGRLAVTARYAGTVSFVDVDAGHIDTTVVVGSDPFGVVQVGEDVYVAVAGEGDLARVSPASGRVVSRVPLTDDDPRGLVVSDDKLVVGHFTSGRLAIVDPARDLEVGTVAMNLPSRPFFAPNQIEQLTLDPVDPAVVVVPHVECNNDPAQFGDQTPASFGGRVAYYTEGPTGFPAVVPGISRADVDVGVGLSDDPPATADDTERSGPTSPIINPLDRAALGNVHVNGPVATAIVDNGALELIVARSSGNVVIRRTHVENEQNVFVAVVDVGVGADSIVLSPDGHTASVFNAFDQSITSFSVPASGDFNDDEPGGPIERLTARRFVVAEQVLRENVVRGRALFHAVDDRLTAFGAIACASCHPGGADDGTTWQFAEGPRQSPPLWGGIVGTEPFHWDGAVRDMADISRVTIVGRMGGTGLPRVDMDAIGAFLDTLAAPAPPSTVLAAGASIARGAAIFRALDCAQCHAGVQGTSPGTHDVGTGLGVAPRETARAFATPPLVGLTHSAPYLHDGSAPTLRALVEQLVVSGRMVGAAATVAPATLTPAEIDDLVAYLASL
jgi:mono/diheme cytochrome c family protein